MKKWILAWCAGMLMGNCAAFAADSNGQYMVGGGIGSVSCVDFISAMEEARRLGWTRSAASMSGVASFIAFLSGFQTAYNAHVADTCDLFRAQDGSDLTDRLMRVENVCRQAAGNIRFGVAVLQHADSVADQRTRVCPKKDPAPATQ